MHGRAGSREGGRAVPEERGTKHRPAAWRERSAEKEGKRSGEGEHRELRGCNLECKETPPVPPGGVPACPLSAVG